VIDGTPQIDHLAVHLHLHLFKVPSPVTKATHVVEALPPDFSRDLGGDAVAMAPGSRRRRDGGLDAWKGLRGTASPA
jgi:hypothetical protein